LDGRVEFGTYTGKAASVLHSKGVPNARTLHTLAYRTKEKGRAALRQLEEELLKLLTTLGEQGMQPEDMDQHGEVIKLRQLLSEERKSQLRPLFDINPDSPIRGAALLVVDEVSMVGEQMGKDLESFGTKILVL